MNYKKHIGWYYNSSSDITASWSGVEYLYNFLTTNKGIGPRAIETNINNLEIGDVIQLRFVPGSFGLSLIIVGKNANNLDSIYVATHTEDSYYRKVTTYSYEDIRFLHITDIGIY